MREDKSAKGDVVTMISKVILHIIFLWIVDKRMKVYRWPTLFSLCVHELSNCVGSSVALTACIQCIGPRQLWQWQFDCLASLGEPPRYICGQLCKAHNAYVFYKSSLRMEEDSDAFFLKRPLWCLGAFLQLWEVLFAHSTAWVIRPCGAEALTAWRWNASLVFHSQAGCDVQDDSLAAGCYLCLRW